ncbi:MAG: hypothetical protein H7145_16440 [Akkermansiaceae bacterium]|nr:hypothetical protein [Armatimonadota bacterium]
MFRKIKPERSESFRLRDLSVRHSPVDRFAGLIPGVFGVFFTPGYLPSPLGTGVGWLDSLAG